MAGRRTAVIVALILSAGPVLANPMVGIAKEPTSGGPWLGKADGVSAGVSEVAATVPNGFQDNVALSGLVHPIVIQFAPDGRIFVAEKSGIIKVFDNLADTTPTIFADLQTQVDDYWDRGLIGLALPPTFPSDPHVYVSYTYDAPIGGTAPVWNDVCPTPPGPTTDGCVVSGRLSRLTASGNVMVGPEEVLINDWCQQHPSHSVGALLFGADGALYMSSGDGASFTLADYGQTGGSTGSPTPRNPCGDPPAGVGGVMTPPAAEGGALRSQDVRTIPTGGASYASTVLADSPAAYWRLGEAGGTLADDVVGSLDGTYAATGVTLNRPGALAGDANPAVLFDPAAGGNVAVAANGTTLDAGDGPLTIEAWVKKTNQNVDYGIVSRGIGGYYLRIGADNTLQLLASQTAEIAHSTVTITGTAWHHVVTTKNGAAVKLYIDGADVTGAVSNVPFVNPNDTFHIGSDTGANEVIDGTLDEVAIYRSVLSASRILAHYTAGTTGGGGSTDPTTLDGAILRLDPATGAAMPGNPLGGSSDLMARRIIAHGLRNPFRFTQRPGTSELWIDDVGWGTWEELDLLATPGASLTNYGWPCYEGVGRQATYDGLDLSICENLYAEGTGAVASPYFTYNHSAKVVSDETCPTANGSSITGLAFYQGGSYPTSFNGGLFFADYSRDCMWFMPALANGRPNTASVIKFIEGAANPVDLKTGPGGDLFYADFDGGTIHRVTYFSGNQPPTAVIQAAPTSGNAPLVVSFNGSGSSDPESGALTYAWDFDGNGTDDATGATTSHTYSTPGSYLAQLRVTDPLGASDTDTVTISVNNTPPVPTITAPVATLTWSVGDVISFSGGAMDNEEGNLPASALTWSFVLHHCPVNPNDCHTHTVQTINGVASGTFAAPDHEYPSYLEVVLTATDNGGLQASTSVRIDPKTVTLSFATSPSGLQLAVGSSSSTAPFTRTVIRGSRVTIAATSPQSLNGASYGFVSWSDGGAQSHDVTPLSNTSYAATYQAISADLDVSQTAQVSPGQVVFTITVQNLGPAGATGVTMTDQLPSKLSFTSATTSAGSCGYQSGTRTVSCSPGSIPNGAIVTITIQTRNTQKGTVSNTASVTATSPDPVTGNNSATVSVRLR